MTSLDAPLSANTPATPGTSLPEAPWAMPVEALAQALDSDPVRGLTDEEAARRLEIHGPNEIAQARQEPWWKILVRQVMNLIALLLVLAAVMSAVLNEWLEVAAIALALLINVAIGFVTELKALRSIEALRRMSQVTTRVVRGGRVKEVPTHLVVPGDLVDLEAGDVMAADMRVVESARLRANESALTGESLPIDKVREPLPAETILAERANMLYKGAALHMGSGKALVTGTGMLTELGRIAALTQAARAEQSPLEKRLNSLGGKLFWITLAVAAVVIVAGLVSGMGLALIVQTSIALAVATIPEGLPIVATIALAQGMWRMAARNAVVTRLSAVETLGTVTVLCSDKTGTLTENRMRLTHLLLANGHGAPEEHHLMMDGAMEPACENGAVRCNLHALEEAAVQVGVLCNNAQLADPAEAARHAAQPVPGQESPHVGDPLEVALLEAGRDIAMERDALLATLPEAREEAFDPDTVMMATYHGQPGHGGYLAAVKGAPERVLAVCTHVLTAEGEVDLDEHRRAAWQAGNHLLAAQGLRLLGLARKTVASPDEPPYGDLTLVGLAGLSDPPREDVKGVIRHLSESGIRLVMVTGDQPATAVAIGKSLGLMPADREVPAVIGADLKSPAAMSEAEKQAVLATNVFARVSPEQKLDLISLFQDAGAVVGMTGDGVNDAPALKKADIGIAMGLRGTQVAQEAADLVLKDDALSTVAMAVDQGRVIFNNIRKFIVYLLSGNVGQLMIIGVAMGLGASLPLLPLQILYLNMVSDIFPALALGLGQGKGAPPPPQPRGAREPLLSAGHWSWIFLYGGVIAGCILLADFLAYRWLHLTPEQSVTVTFLSLALSRTWHTFNMRERGTGILVNDITCNPFAWAAVGISLGLVALAVLAPPVARALSVVDPGREGWLLIVVTSFVPFVIIQAYKSLVKRGVSGV